MRLPRDLAGRDLAARLRRYGYDVTRQTGSHLRLTSRLGGRDHHITVPQHEALRVATLRGILTEVAHYLERPRDQLVDELFGS